MIKKLICTAILAAVFLPLSAQNQNQSAYNTWGNVDIVPFESDLEGMQRTETIYSKARGITIFSAINNVNNRALRKLQTEAAMLGADAIYITNNYQKGVQFYSPVQVTYSAVTYRQEPLTLEKVNELVEGKTFQYRTKIRYNRNAFGPKMSMTDQRPHIIEGVYEERGHIYVDLMLEKYKRPYRVVKVSENQLILARIIDKDKIIENYELVAPGEVKEKISNRPAVINQVFPFLK
jgi:hypothetical protein